MIDCSRIGARIKEARERLGMTQTQLADEIGVSRDVVANYESGRIPNGPPVGRLICIAKACDVSIDWLLESE